MTTIATLAVKLIADAAGFISAMDEAQKKTQTWSQSVSTNMKNVGGSIYDVGQKSTTFLTLPLAAAAISAFTMAADMQDAIGATEQIYGDSANTVKNWALNLESYYGIAQNEALSYSNMMGSMLQNIGGLSKDEAASQASSLIELAGDLTAMYGGTTQDAVRALTGALKGNNTMLDNYGMVATDAMIKQKAFEMGLSDGTSELSASAKQAATLALIMEQASAAQGQAAREADGASGSLRAQVTEMKNLAIAIGTMLLPYATQLLTWISQAIAWFQALTPEQQKWVVGFAAIIAIAGPLLMVIGGLITAIGTIVGVVGAISAPIWIVIAVIAALIAIGYLLYQAWINNWGGIQEKTAAVLAFIQGLIQMGLQFIEDLTTGKLGAVSQIWNNTFLFIQTYIQNFIIFWQAIFAAFAAAANGDWYAFGENMRVAFDTMLNTIGALIQTSWANISTAVSALVTNVIEFFKTVDWGAVGTSIVQGIANGITAAVGFIRQAAQSAAQAALDAAKGFLGIKSPARRPRKEVGYPIGQGQGLGWIDGLTSMIPAVQNSVDNMMRMAMPSVMPAVPELSAAGVGVPAVNQSLRNGGTKMIVVPVTYEDHSLINVNKEYEAKAKLREIVNDINRENENK